MGECDIEMRATSVTYSAVNSEWICRKYLQYFTSWRSHHAFDGSVVRREKKMRHLRNVTNVFIRFQCLHDRVKCVQCSTEYTSYTVLWKIHCKTSFNWLQVIFNGTKLWVEATNFNHNLWIDDCLPKIYFGLIFYRLLFLLLFRSNLCFLIAHNCCKTNECNKI